jgi:hypothetical protein
MHSPDTARLLYLLVCVAPFIRLVLGGPGPASLGKARLWAAAVGLYDLVGAYLCTRFALIDETLTFRADPMAAAACVFGALFSYKTHKSPPWYQNPHLGTFFRLEIAANQCERAVCVVNEAPVTSYTCVLPSQMPLGSIRTTTHAHQHLHPSRLGPRFQPLLTAASRQPGQI